MAEAQLGPGSQLLDKLLLAPCLRTRDLLSLAASATWLRPYRSLLRDIKIKAWRDDVTPAMLSVQRRLHTLQLGAAEVLGRLVTSLRGEEDASPGMTLRRLILEWEEETPASEEGARELGAWLAEGGCSLLEELDMSRASFTPAAASHVYQGLTGCPELRCLRSYSGRPEALAAALESGACPKLQELSVVCHAMMDRQSAPLAKALQAFARPDLRELHVSVMDLEPDFGNALRSGACRGLRVLRLDLIEFQGAGGEALAEALGEGACPDLTVLALDKPYMYPQDAQALGQAMRAGGLARLEELRIRHSVFLLDDEGVGMLAPCEALGEGAFPDLMVLALEDNHLGPQAARALAQAMRAGYLARLEELRLSKNPLADEGVVALAQELEEGACPDLTVLALEDTKSAPQGAEALAQAMRTAHLSRLEELRLSKNPLLDEGVVALAEELGEGACPRLREIHLAEVGMEGEGIQALVRAARGGGLPSLSCLDIRGNHLWDDGAEGLAPEKGDVCGAGY
jgi:hypothetical protein